MLREEFLKSVGMRLSPAMKEKCSTFEWGKKTGTNPDAPKASATLGAVPESVEDMHNKSIQVAKLGYQKGAFVVNKESEQVSLWKIVSV